MRLKKCTPDADPETNCDVTAWVAHTLPYEEKDYYMYVAQNCVKNRYILKHLSCFQIILSMTGIIIIMVFNIHKEIDDMNMLIVQSVHHVYFLHCHLSSSVLLKICHVCHTCTCIHVHTV